MLILALDYSLAATTFYTECGIPYRRGYLFYGPPGTGKSSLSAAIAGHLKCDLYMINLSSNDVSDGKLQSLFLALPRKCVVLIEDIDSAGIDREQPRNQQAPPPLTPGAIHPAHMALMTPSPAKSRVTLSGLLNAIDGNASQEGRLLIMVSAADPSPSTRVIEKVRCEL